MVKEIYLDNAATTRVDSGVAKKVQEIFLKTYGNASSQHSSGTNARKELEDARRKIADYVGCDISEIIFTGGGTESNNLALRGLAKANPDKKHIITSVIEHPCILETCKDLENAGYEVDYIKVNEEGIVNVKDIKSKIRGDTLVVSIMHVNNEIGTIQPVEEIADACKKRNVYFHTDAVQGFTKVKLDLKNVDLLSASGHKFYGPKGIGFLFVRKGVKIDAIITGGGQEGGLRSGTENVPGVVGMAAALDVSVNKDEIGRIRDYMIKELLEIPGTKINGSLKDRVYHNINVSFFGIEGESLMLLLDKDGIYVSTGSACASTKLKESYVLKEIGVDAMYINGSLRITLGEISDKDAEFVLDKIRMGVKKLREISPFKLNSREAK
jgi:cysteine desulfurase